MVSESVNEHHNSSGMPGENLNIKQDPKGFVQYVRNNTK